MINIPLSPLQIDASMPSWSKRASIAVHSTRMFGIRGAEEESYPGHWMGENGKLLLIPQLVEN